MHSSADVRASVIGAIRGAFEYQGQKCSALSRLYVPKSMWEAPGGFKEILVEEIAKITVGPPQEFGHFMGPVMYVLPPSSCSADETQHQILVRQDPGLRRKGQGGRR